MGRPAILDQKLVGKIAKKLGRTNLNIGKSISALASEKSISPEAALVVMAKRHGIGAANFQRTLSQEKNTEVRSVLGDSNQAISPIPRKVKGLPKKYPNTAADFSDPYLANPQLPTEAYSILFILENSLRLFITRVLSATYGQSWWTEIVKKKATQDIATKVNERKTNESSNWHHSKRGVHEIYYTDYSGLLTIMRSFDPQFSPYFKKLPEKNLPGKLAELTQTRNIVAHNNPIGKNDLDRLRVHARDWMKYMQALYKQK